MYIYVPYVYASYSCRSVEKSLFFDCLSARGLGSQSWRDPTSHIPVNPIVYRGTVALYNECRHMLVK